MACCCRGCRLEAPRNFSSAPPGFRADGLARRCQLSVLILTVEAECSRWLRSPWSLSRMLLGCGCKCYICDRAQAKWRNTTSTVPNVYVRRSSGSTLEPEACMRVSTGGINRLRRGVCTSMDYRWRWRWQCGCGCECECKRMCVEKVKATRVPKRESKLSRRQHPQESEEKTCVTNDVR